MHPQPVTGHRTNARPGLARRASAVGIALAATLLSSACAAGQLAQTADQKATIDGVNKDVGSIDLRALAVKAPVGKPYYVRGVDAEIKLVIVNNATTADTLTSISSTSASGWGSYATAEDGSVVQAADSEAATAPSTSASASTGTAPSSSGSASTPAAPSASPTASQSVAITAGNRVSYGTPESTKVLLLRMLKARLYPGTTIPVTFTFARAGSVTVAVPVQLSDSPGTATIQKPSGSESVPN